MSQEMPQNAEKSTLIKQLVSHLMFILQTIIREVYIKCQCWQKNLLVKRITRYTLYIGQCLQFISPVITSQFHDTCVLLYFKHPYCHTLLQHNQYLQILSWNQCSWTYYNLLQANTYLVFPQYSESQGIIINEKIYMYM